MTRQGAEVVGCVSRPVHAVREPADVLLADVVELSAALARERGIYDTLVKSELLAFMGNTDGQYDVVVSADTLVYFGRLDAVFVAVRRVLATPGQLVFTLESHTAATDFTLQPHGRYSHSRHYVAAELERAGFGAIDIQEVVLRYEGAEPVAGWLVCAQPARR